MLILARQVPVPGLQEPAVDVAVDGLLADGDHVGVVDDGRVYRLPFSVSVWMSLSIATSSSSVTFAPSRDLERMVV